MRKGQSLDQHIDRLSMDAFEEVDPENRFVLVSNNHRPLGRPSFTVMGHLSFCPV